MTLCMHVHLHGGGFGSELAVMTMQGRADGVAVTVDGTLALDMLEKLVYMVLPNQVTADCAHGSHAIGGLLLDVWAVAGSRASLQVRWVTSCAPTSCLCRLASKAPAGQMRSNCPSRCGDTRRMSLVKGSGLLACTAASMHQT
eukprot:363712-Chlamydomonas_euryale.AAC.3